MDDLNTSVADNDTGLQEETQGIEEVAEPTTEQTEQETEKVEADLPEDSSERTRQQFEKLKQHNAELARKNAELEKRAKFGNSVYDFGDVRPSNQFTPQVNTQNLTNAQVDNIVADFIDSEGNVDVASLNKALREANERANRAEVTVKQFVETQRQAEEQRQLKEAYKVAPWLDNNSPSFDEKKFNLTRDRLARYWFEGKNPDLTSVAQEIESELGSFASPQQVAQEKEKAIKESRENINKVNASSNVSNSRTRVVETSLEELQKASRKGSMDAIAERLKQSGY